MSKNNQSGPSLLFKDTTLVTEFTEEDKISFIYNLLAASDIASLRKDSKLNTSYFTLYTRQKTYVIVITK